MKKSFTGKTASIKQRFLIFSIVFFLVVILGGSAAFFLSMRQIVRTNKDNELLQIAELERSSLEASVNGEIAIALKMADSPLVKRYFRNPGDPVIAALAFEEIAGYRRAFAANSVFWVNDIDHLFYINADPPFFMDVNDPNNYWYLMTLNETESYNFNINYNPDLNVTNLWINAPVFDDDGRPLGILGTGIDLTSFIDSIYRDYRSDADLYFINMAGEVTGARDARMVADKVTIDQLLPGIGTDILAWVEGSPDTARIFSGLDGEIAVGPVPALEWYAIVSYPFALADFLDTGMTGLFISMMALIFLIFVIVNVFIRTILRPLSKVITALNQISRDWDLVKRLEVHRKDEIGNLSEFFNQTFEEFRLLLHGIKGMAFSLSDTGDELSANMDETNKAVELINSAIKSMRIQILTQADEVNSAADSMDRIIRGLDKLNENISLQADSVAQSSSAIEEMLANVNSVTQTLVKNAENISSLASSSEAGRADLQKVSSDIQEIAKESEGLLEINSVMESIASQTNLLSMNAAIEAAHAGESGKGFAVVAGEIRKLAENSGKQSNTISQVLQKIKASIDTITHSTMVVLERFQTIEQEVEIVTNQETQIRNAMEEQGIGSRQILEAISRLNSLTDMVQRASSDMSSDSKAALKQSSTLKDLTSEVAGTMDEMNESTENIVSAVIRAKEISLENNHNIGSLGKEMAKFKLD